MRIKKLIFNRFRSFYGSGRKIKFWAIESKNSKIKEVVECKIFFISPDFDQTIFQSSQNILGKRKIKLLKCEESSRSG